MNRLETESASNPKTLNVAFNYGGRQDILQAVNAVVQKNGIIDEASVSEALYTGGCPDPDLVVRTGGEMRISNFLLWQSAYAELYFTDTLWPDMDKKDVDAAIAAFMSRNRRFGGV